MLQTKMKTREKASTRFIIGLFLTSMTWTCATQFEKPVASPSALLQMAIQLGVKPTLGNQLLMIAVLSNMTAVEH